MVFFIGDCYHRLDYETAYDHDPHGQIFFSDLHMSCHLTVRQTTLFVKGRESDGTETA